MASMAYHPNTGAQIGLESTLLTTCTTIIEQDPTARMKWTVGVDGFRPTISNYHGGGYPPSIARLSYRRHLCEIGLQGVLYRMIPIYTITPLILSCGVFSNHTALRNSTPD